MNLTIILAGLAIILFFIYFFYTGAQRSSYLLFVAIFLPLMDLGVTPAALGALSVFDAISFFSLFLCYKDILHVSKKNNAYLYLFLIFLALLFLGSISSEFVSRSLFSILTVIPPFIFIRLLLKEMEANPAFLKKMLAHLKIACLVAIGFIGIQMIVGLDFTFYSSLNQNVMDGGKIRYPGFFPDSQLSGVFLAMMSFLFLLNLNNPKRPATINYIYFAVAMLAVIIAGSRSALIGFAAGLFVLAIFVGGNFRATALIFGVVIGGLLLYFSESFVLFERFNSLDDSLDFRASIWDGAYEIFKKNFSFGIGINNYQDYAKLHAQDQFLLIDNDEILFLDAPENGYLKLLTEFGFFAFVTLFLLILSPLINVFFQFIMGKKVSVAFYFVAPVVCWFLSFTSLYTLSDSRIIIALCANLSFLIAYPINPSAEHEV
jgi:O-antigen ligase